MTDIHEAQEARALELALEALDSATPITADSPEEEAAAREVLEILTLLPRALEAETPRPAVKARLMAAVVEEAVAEEAVVPVGDFGARKAAAQRPAASMFSLAIAAALGFCVVGLGFLIWQVDQQRVVNAELAKALEQLRDVQQATLTKLATTERRFKMVTNTAREMYVMEPSQEELAEAIEASSAPHGVLYVCGQHQRWYMNLKDLEPAPSGREYYLWFLDEAQNPLSGLPFEVGPDAIAELDDQSMPVGTRAFMVTLETEGDHATPSGEIMILGDRAIPI